jgi:hypothetical protein
MNTPWGVSQGKPATIADGITFYHTARHGGFHLSPERLASMPAALRAARTDDGPDCPWFEEDCDYSLVVLAFPEYFTPEERDTAVRSARVWSDRVWSDKTRDMYPGWKPWNLPWNLDVDRYLAEQARDLPFLT